MITFHGIQLNTDSPIYLQIVDFVKRGVASGNVAYGEEVPSRRMLSALLGVNPNTAQKAYGLLEQEGIISSRPGAKSEIVVTPEKAKALREELISQDVDNLVGAMQSLAIDKDEAVQLLLSRWT